MNTLSNEAVVNILIAIVEGHRQDIPHLPDLPITAKSDILVDAAHELAKTAYAIDAGKINENAFYGEVIMLAARCFRIYQDK